MKENSMEMNKFDKYLIPLMQQSFAASGDRYSSKEVIYQINWNTFGPTEQCDRVQKACKVCVSVKQDSDHPFGGVCWLQVRDGELYTGWETVRANTLIPYDFGDYLELYKLVEKTQVNMKEFSVLLSNPVWKTICIPDSITIILSHSSGDAIRFNGLSSHMHYQLMVMLCEVYPELDGKLESFQYKRFPAAIKFIGYTVDADIRHLEYDDYKLTIYFKEK